MNRIDIIMRNATFLGFGDLAHDFMSIGTLDGKHKYVAMQLDNGEFMTLRWNFVDGKDRYTYLPQKFCDYLMLAVYPHEPRGRR
jgi:hypothetical protein